MMVTLDQQMTSRRRKRCGVSNATSNVEISVGSPSTPMTLHAAKLALVSPLKTSVKDNNIYLTVFSAARLTMKSTVEISVSDKKTDN